MSEVIRELLSEEVVAAKIKEIGLGMASPQGMYEEPHTAERPLVSSKCVRCSPIWCKVCLPSMRVLQA